MSYGNKILWSQPIDKSAIHKSTKSKQTCRAVKSTLLSDRFQNSKLKEDIEVAELNIFVDLRLKKVKKIKVDE